MGFLVAAISLGFLGSFHCIGMCGPIALALPVHHKPRGQQLAAIFAYNAGRMLTYACFGIVFGSIGEGLAFFGFQQALSVALGVLLLLGLFFGRFAPVKAISSGNYKLLSGLKEKIAHLFEKHGLRSFLGIGLLNGLLPCGLVYVAAAGAAATRSAWQGALFMALFGAGTLPFMFGISYFSQSIGLRARNTFRKLVPIAVAAMAVLLILRGANLGIRYVSPALAAQQKANRGNDQAAKINCCHKK